MHISKHSQVWPLPPPASGEEHHLCLCPYVDFVPHLTNIIGCGFWDVLLLFTRCKGVQRALRLQHGQAQHLPQHHSHEGEDHPVAIIKQVNSWSEDGG